MKIELVDTSDENFSISTGVFEINTESIGSPIEEIVTITPPEEVEKTPPVEPQRGAPLENPRGNSFDFFEGTSWAGKKQGF